MSMRCTVCRHDKRLKIEKEIVKNIPHTKIAKLISLITRLFVITQ